MNNNDKINFIIKKKFFIFFFIFFLIGISITKDYGVSSDEYASRIRGFVNLNYVGDKLFPKLTESVKGQKDIPYLHNYQQKIYGPVFESTASFLEILFNLEEKNDQFLLRHYLNFIIFFVSVIFFYRIIYLRLRSKNFAFLGSIFLILSPRIFANSFYNNKDLVFLSFIIISSYYCLKFLKNKNVKNSLKFAFFTAIAIDIRILGILLLITNLSLSLYKDFFDKTFVRNFFINFFSISLCLIFVIIFWPFLWEKPFDNFLFAFNNMANFSIDINNLFFGELINAKNVPWYFLITWIFITTPILYLFLFVIGLFFVIFNFFKDKFILTNHNSLMDLFFIILFFAPLVATVLFNSTIYNGWRQVYFIYPGLIYLSVIGLFFIRKYFNDKLLKFSIMFLVLYIISIFYWIVSNHPHQYAYFNLLISKKEIHKKFDIDYWGLSYKESLEIILKNDNRDKIKISNLSTNKLFYPLWFFENKDRSRFVQTNINNADYLITNYYLPKEKINKFILKENYTIFHDVIVDNFSINRVYKKNN